MKLRTMAVVAVLFLSAVVVFGADSEFDGKWTGSYESGMGGNPMNMEFTFKADGNELKGTTLGGANGEQIPISDGKIDGNKISFTVNVMLGQQAMVFKYTGELAKDKLKLKFDSGNSNGTFTVTKKKEKEEKEKDKKKK